VSGEVIRHVAVHAWFSWLSHFFQVVETQKEEEPSMRYRGSILGDLLKQIDRRQFAAIVDRYNGNAYDKTFDSWNHLVCLIGAQLSGAQSLRELEAAWRANGHHHYHLGVGRLRRSTLSDANQRRPAAIFAELFSGLSAQATRVWRREGEQMVRLIDSTPIPLGQTVRWAQWNGRIRGLKLHVVYDPQADVPHRQSITPSVDNDIAFGRQMPIEAAATYVFDRAYCHYGWWTKIDQAGAFFVTRRRTNSRFRTVHLRPPGRREGDGFSLLQDAEVEFASKGDSKLDINLRLIRLRRHDSGKTLEILTNDMKRPAGEIAALYRTRWQIELLFRWIKQHLNIRRFIGTSDNAIRLQILAAMIAFLLLRIAARLHRVALPAIRFAQLVGQCLFVRKPIARIDKPPEINLSCRLAKADPNQLNFLYA
jgi:putative transposase